MCIKTNKLLITKIEKAKEIMDLGETNEKH